MGYSSGQLRDLESPIDAAGPYVVVTGMPIDLAHVIRSHQPFRRASFELEAIGTPRLEELLAPIVVLAATAAATA